MKANKWIINKQINGMPNIEDFTCIEEEIPSCGQGDIIVKAEYLSVDPYMRLRLKTSNSGDMPHARQLAKVIESKNESFPVGMYVIAYLGWRDCTHISSEQVAADKDMRLLPMPDIGGLPKSLTLGMLGMPGNTAYFGFQELCSPKPGETVLVNGAAGAVGSAVVQIAKIRECRVIAFAGSDEKVSWVKELGADYVYNYKTTNISDAIKESAPDGIDCFFDNVGGSFSAEVMPHMALYGRIAVCGVISSYNDTLEVTEEKKSPYIGNIILWKQIRIEGFLVHRWANRHLEGISQMTKWIKEGKLKSKETTTNGFDKMPKAFIGLFYGENIGKAIVKV